mmetsp:Transcript_112575/g.281986  ORF Transcript_112575/g.281986 Transcript_112575/m.281986 type:complete len:356 (-) Transcript_112575:44-1111(-)
MQQTTKTVGFIGLGAMGYPMAGHMARLAGHRCLVWNRSAGKAERHAAEFGSYAVCDVAALGEADVLVMCLPTSEEDAAMAELLAPHLPAEACIVSCTSGEPSATKHLAASLMDRFGLHFLDCPVSGGPRGATAGSLTCMLGADDEAAAERVIPVVQSFSKKVVRCGPVGAGHAVKAVNNALNVTHLLLGHEGLLALQRLGVDPSVAVEAINGSSGRSLQTEQRLPQEVLSGRFGYGFKLPLMAKDCRIAAKVLEENLPAASLLPAAAKLVQEATRQEPEDADYTRVVCHLERKTGAELRAGSAAPAVTATEAAAAAAAAATAGGEPCGRKGQRSEFEVLESNTTTGVRLVGAVAM